MKTMCELYNLLASTHNSYSMKELKALRMTHDLNNILITGLIYFFSFININHITIDHFWGLILTIIIGSLRTS